MPVSKPFKRTARPQSEGKYFGTAHYIKHPKYALSPQQYIRAFEILQKDVLELFDYVEPSDANKGCYSYRIHELHTRACIEVEANCKAILSENGYSRSGDWNMTDYAKLNGTHRLSSFEVHVPHWQGQGSYRTPFAGWKTQGKLPWYQAYNKVKHSRHENFAQSNLENMIDAVCGVVAILGSQFVTIDFGPEGYVADSSPIDGYEIAIGGYFDIKFPDDWPVDEWYGWKWEDICNELDPFQKHFA